MANARQRCPHGIACASASTCSASCIFLALPFFNVVRFDIPRQRFYFAGYELWINEFAIVFFSLMFLMFLVVVSSVFYGRVYCGYLCPQMIFSEASMALRIAPAPLGHQTLHRLEARRARLWLRRALFYAAVGVASVLLAFIFISYFVEPRDLFRRLLSLRYPHRRRHLRRGRHRWSTFLDFTLLRLRFCTTVCPYGYLQGMLGDGNTLLVHYRDETHECIECKKCVRVCPMGIDIRQSPFQIECIHCAECIDACDEILARLNKPGLIHYAWGEKGPLASQQRQPWDAKRIIVLLVLAVLRLRPDRGAGHAPRRAGAHSARPRHALPPGRRRPHLQPASATPSPTAAASPAAVAFSIRNCPARRSRSQPIRCRSNPANPAQGQFEISVARRQPPRNGHAFQHRRHRVRPDPPTPFP